MAATNNLRTEGVCRFYETCTYKRVEWIKNIANKLALSKLQVKMLIKLQVRQCSSLCATF